VVSGVLLAVSDQVSRLSGTILLGRLWGRDEVLTKSILAGISINSTQIHLEICYNMHATTATITQVKVAGL
jgi:hypothetical protein